MKKRVVGIAASIAMLAVAVGVPQGAVAQERQEREALVWGPCEGGASVTGAVLAPAGRVDNPMECATLRVPLDYANPSQTIGIALNRIRGRPSTTVSARCWSTRVAPGRPAATWSRGSRRGFPTAWPTGSTWSDSTRAGWGPAIPR